MLEEKIVFVYGTLKTGMRNHSVMKRIKGEFQFPAETVRLYPMFDLGNGFPYLQDTKHTGHIIQGEVFKVPGKSMKELDYFEGVPDLYKKGMIEVEFEGNVIEANCYFITDELDRGELEQVKFFSEWLED